MNALKENSYTSLPHTSVIEGPSPNIVPQIPVLQNSFATCPNVVNNIDLTNLSSSFVLYNFLKISLIRG